MKTSFPTGYPGGRDKDVNLGREGRRRCDDKTDWGSKRLCGAIESPSKMEVCLGPVYGGAEGSTAVHSMGTVLLFFFECTSLPGGRGSTTVHCTQRLRRHIFLVIVERSPSFEGT